MNSRSHTRAYSERRSFSSSHQCVCICKLCLVSSNNSLISAATCPGLHSVFIHVSHSLATCALQEQPCSSAMHLGFRARSRSSTACFRLQAYAQSQSSAACHGFQAHTHVMSPTSSICSSSGFENNLCLRHASDFKSNVGLQRQISDFKLIHVHMSWTSTTASAL